MSIARPAAFVHVVYRTRQFARMLDWYQTVFGARIQHQGGPLAFLTYDEEHHRFAFIDLNVVDPQGVEEGRSGRGGPVGVDHVAYTYPSLDVLLGNYERLKALGIVPYWCIHHGITISMYYGDPDGNQMEFQVDCFASTDLANEFMRGPNFAANPIGVEYDPQAWLTRVKAGEPASALLTRTVHLPVSPIRSASLV